MLVCAAFWVPIYCVGLSSTNFFNKYLVNSDFVLYIYDSKRFYCKFLAPRLPLEMRKGLVVKIPNYPLPLLSFKNGPQGEAIAMKCLILL